MMQPGDTVRSKRDWSDERTVLAVQGEWVWVDDPSDGIPFTTRADEWEVVPPPPPPTVVERGGVCVSGVLTWCLPDSPGVVGVMVRWSDGSVTWEPKP